jgi:hypothetical protein
MSNWPTDYDDARNNYFYDEISKFYWLSGKLLAA